jgi:hypothetical protein
MVKNVLLEMHHIGNCEEFSCINSSLQCCNGNEDCEEAVVEQIAATCQKISEDEENIEGDMN